MLKSTFNPLPTRITGISTCFSCDWFCNSNTLTLNPLCCSSNSKHAFFSQRGSLGTGTAAAGRVSYLSVNLSASVIIHVWLHLDALCVCVCLYGQRQLCNTPDSSQDASKPCVISNGSHVGCYKSTMAFTIDLTRRQMSARGHLNASCGICVTPLCLAAGHVTPSCLAHSIN